MLDNLKYVPVIRFREQERKAFSSTSISNKMAPLVEIMMEKPRSNSKEDSIQTFIREFANLNTMVMLDFPLYLTLGNNTQPVVSQFVRRLKANPRDRIRLFLDQRLNLMQNLIPVITYDPTTAFRSGDILYEESQLRPRYECIAFRIFPNHFKAALSEISRCITHGDIVIFDIDEQSHYNSVIRQLYPLISQNIPQTQFTKVLLRSAIPRDLTNVGLTSGQIVTEADNGLLTDYSILGFDAFGDYVGVKKDELTSGGRISPGYIIYSWSENAFYGFNGVLNQPVTFETQIVPDLLASSVWGQYVGSHKANCLGCSVIQDISRGNKSGKSQPEWKGFAIAHYLYTMEEFL